MRQAIVTKYLGPTNTRGARVKAKAYAGSVIVSWDDALGTDANHDAAARALADKLGWMSGHRLEGGGLPDSKGNCYVLIAVSEGAKASRHLDCRHLACGAVLTGAKAPK